MLVYRVEKNGLGPYANHDVDEHLDYRLRHYWDIDQRPGPLRDGIGVYVKTIHFGFKDIESLKKWFHGARSALRKNGFVLAIYDVPESSVYIGNKQVGFVMSKAWPIKTVKIP